MKNLEQLPSQKPENMPEKEISPELVGAIEKGAFSVDDKVNMLLTQAGLKPASELNIVIRTWDDKESFQNTPEEFIQENIDIVKQLGLPHEIGSREIVDCEGDEKIYKREQIAILIGRTAEDLDFLKQALKSGDSAMLGKAYGFPPTAVEAWSGKREKFNVKKLPKKVRQSEAMLFSSPTLSADNWQAEIKQGQRDADYIKSISPFIYREWIDMMKRSRE